jgi:DNA-binding Xre family transcriptional regulator
MAYNGKKTMAMIRQKGIKAKDFKAAVFPNRSGSFTWAEIERAKDLNASTLEGIAELLDCSIDEFFDRKPVNHTQGDHIEADNNSTAFKNTNTCDQRLLSLLETRDRQLDKAQEQLDRAQKQSDRLLALLESAGRN